MARIANNEQRFAPNIKNVLSTTSFGDVLGSNVGEFLKFIPGLTAEYSEVEIVGISVRGIGGNKTAFTADGAPLVSANATPTRTFNIGAMALNNVSRIEVTNAPYDNRSGFNSASASVRRRLGFLTFPASVQAGAYRSVMTIDSRQGSSGWTYNGADGNPNTPALKWPEFDPHAPMLLELGATAGKWKNPSA